MYKIVILISLSLLSSGNDVCQQRKEAQQIEGDVVITALLGLHFDQNCLIASKRSYDVMQIAIQSVHLINKEKIIPGVKFGKFFSAHRITKLPSMQSNTISSVGLQVYDTCCDVEKTRNLALKALIVGNYTLCANRLFAGFIGPLDIESSLDLSQFLNPLGIPHLQLSPNGQNSEFRNVLQLGTNSLDYPLQALLAFLQKANMRVVTIIYSNDIYGQRLLSLFKQLNSHNICVSAFIELSDSKRNRLCDPHTPENLILLTSEQSTLTLLSCLRQMNLEDTSIIVMRKSLVEDLESVNCEHLVAIEETIEDASFTREYEDLWGNNSLVTNETISIELPIHNITKHQIPVVRKTMSSFYLIAEALKQLFRKRCAPNSRGLCEALLNIEPSEWTKTLASTSYIFKGNGFKGVLGKKVGFGRKYFPSSCVYLLLDETETLREIGYFRGKEVTVHPFLEHILPSNSRSKCSPECSCLPSTNVELLINNRIPSTPAIEKDHQDSVILRHPISNTSPLSDLIGYLVGFTLFIIVMITIFVIILYKTTSCKSPC